jgi:hypothetical protein
MSASDLGFFFAWVRSWNAFELESEGGFLKGM